MPDVADFAAAIGSLKAAFEIAKTLVDARDAAVFRSKIGEFQREILAAQSSAISAQQAQATMLENVRQLKEEVAELKAWDAEKQKYKLTKLSPHADVFGYTLKEQSDPLEPQHSLCATCFQDHIKSVLQVETRMPLAKVLVCPRCGTDLYLTGHPHPQHAQSVRKPPRRSR